MVGVETRLFNTGATRDVDDSKLTELAWTAGFFDGEGSTSCSSNNGKPHTRIQVSLGQKDAGKAISPALLRFHRAIGVGSIYRKSRTKGPDLNQHQFVACSKADVLWCISKLSPFLSEVKLQQIENALAQYFNTNGKNYAE